MEEGEKYRALPPYLYQGSTGAAVKHLQRWFRKNKVGPFEQLSESAEFFVDGKLATCLKELQHMIVAGNQDVKVDGQFGPATRQALHQVMIEWQDCRIRSHPDDLVMDEGDETSYIDNLGNTKRWNANTACAEGAVVTIS